jgi:hypothetical protein
MENPNSLTNSNPAAPATTLRSQPVIVKFNDKFSEGLLYVRDVKTPERLLYAAKIWALMWLCAALSIPIMVIHLILIPGFLIAGPILGFKRLGITEAHDHATGTCPNCQKDFTVPTKPFGCMPIWANCPSCKTWLCLLDKKGFSDS